MSGKCVLFGALLGFLLFVRSSNGIPLESSTVKILIPPPQTTEDDSDAVIVEASEVVDGPSSTIVDEEVDGFNSADCLLPKSKGPCRAVIDSWVYSTVTKSCEPFSWSGCGGNNNRFSEKSFCQTHCSKEKLTGVAGSTKQKLVAAPTFPILVPSTNNNTNCPEFDGCGPLKCAVALDSVTGCQKCQCATAANAPESDDGQAKLLPIGSVSGNPDLHNAPKKAEKPEDVCHLPETRGNCRAMMTRWRYNPEIKACIQFHFGGCEGGNSNNFVNQEKCNEFCKGQ